MDKNSKHKFQEELEKITSKLPQKYGSLILNFFGAYEKTVLSFEETIPTLKLFLKFVIDAIENPFEFEPYHKKIRKPVDYYKFGTDFIRPLVDLAKSKVEGIHSLERIEEKLHKKENVVLFANHQTESDPQAISILLEKKFPKLAESIIYVAGERVVTDPLAIPFSMGCDLLCIYSKRYIDHPPEKKSEKQIHNKKTMSLMSLLLQEGGKIIYVAPSGGRDRKNASGKIEVAPFDSGSIEMFYLMAKKAKTRTHFVPLSLSTYDLLPPPETVQRELGEERTAKRGPSHLFFGDFFDMETFPGSTNLDKAEKRALRTEALFKIVEENYQKLTQS